MHRLQLIATQGAAHNPLDKLAPSHPLLQLVEPYVVPVAPLGTLAPVEAKIPIHQLRRDEQLGRLGIRMCTFAIDSFHFDIMSSFAYICIQKNFHIE